MAKVSNPPKFGTNNFGSTVTLRLDDWLVDRIDEMRAEMPPSRSSLLTSRSQVIRSLLEKAIEEYWTENGGQDEG